ncbi:MAG TPA: hypothetical protein VM734_18255, partial [Kofleriaceae bacterium]|nr:hypothetical protein [Kofleriaceae bacterium]
LLATLIALAFQPLADRLLAGDALEPRPPVRFRRTVAIGDPQASARRVFGVLAHHDLLADDGRLRDDVQLISIGDHFDYGTRAQGTTAEAQLDGRRVLRWLSAHDATQVVILAGNHDVARVMELAGATDARFAAGPDRAAYLAGLDDYAATYPELPTPGVVHRDFSAYTEDQRALVAGLLLGGRLRLAATARLGGGELLLTHAGVTTRELGLLGIPDERRAGAIAAALEHHLAAAVDGVRPAWTAGRWTPLSLAPLHVPGAVGHDALDGLPEGGGLLYHRPADPDRPGADRSWENERARPRRYHPKALPAGLRQVAGHTGHPKCVAELVRWRDPDLIEEPAGLRTLWVHGPAIRYELGVRPPTDGAAVLYMIDPSMYRAPSAALEVLELEPGSAT